METRLANSFSLITGMISTNAENKTTVKGAIAFDVDVATVLALENTHTEEEFAQLIGKRVLSLLQNSVHIR